MDGLAVLRRVYVLKVSCVQAASDVVGEVERAVEQYSKGVGHLCQKLPLPGQTMITNYFTSCFLKG